MGTNRRKALVRANGKCERCKKNNAIHVHHILPVRYFANPADAHFLNNTLAVCRSCHNEEHRLIKHRFPLLNQLKLPTLKEIRETRHTQTP